MKLVATVLAAAVVAKRGKNWKRKENDNGEIKTVAAAMELTAKQTAHCPTGAVVNMMAYDENAADPYANVCAHVTNSVQDGRCCWPRVTGVNPFDLEGNPQEAFWASCAVLPYDGLDIESGGCFRMPCPSGKVDNCAAVNAARPCNECPAGWGNDGDGCCRRLINGRKTDKEPCGPQKGTKAVFRAFDTTGAQAVKSGDWTMCLANAYRSKDLCIRSDCIQCKDLFNADYCKMPQQSLHWNEICPQSCNAYNTEFYEDAPKKVTQPMGEIKSNKKKNKRRGQRIAIAQGTDAGQCCKPVDGRLFERLCCRDRNTGDRVCKDVTALNHGQDYSTSSCMIRVGRMDLTGTMRRADDPPANP